MSFSSRRRNYLLTPHRRDGLLGWMKNMLSHSFVLDALDTTAADTFSHFEMLIEEHIEMSKSGSNEASRLKKLVPTVGTFHTPLPLRKAFVAYNKKYALTKRRHITISFNELRHIMNLAQVMALHNGGDGSDKDISSSLERWEKSPGPLQGVRPPSPPPLSLAPFRADQTDTCSKDDFKGPKMITFDGDQTLYSDGANFESNQELASYLYLLLRNGVTIAVVTAAGYEYQKEKYELRLSGLLKYFQDRKLPARDCERFFLFGGECNYLLTLGADFRLCPVKERGGGGWMTSTSFIKDSPANWDETAIQSLLDVAEKSVKESIKELKIRGRSIRKKRSVGLIPNPGQEIPREILDESVLRAQEVLDSNSAQNLSFCAFNGGRDVWVDVGNKRVGVHILSSYLGMSVTETLHIGDQFLNTGNDFAARDICPCIWITSPEETTYILKSILRLAEIEYQLPMTLEAESSNEDLKTCDTVDAASGQKLDFSKMIQRSSQQDFTMDVYTGEFIEKDPKAS